ncbi:MAG: glutamate racemase [Prevotellaceae bacterium]|jgi:glutamate racemase|nr:glutamate racemase [Prevotellaceae bacterium]
MKQFSQQAGAIGIFDSGYGGLTILNKIRATLPEYDYIYLGDNARTPYGTRSFDIVYHYTLQCVTHLFSMGCQLVILACNTASAKALRTIQQNDLPAIDPNRRVLGVIRPTVEAVGELTRSRHVGLLATTGTVQSESYPIEIHKLYPDIQLVAEACPMWVPLIENNEYQTEGAKYFIKKNVQNLLLADEQIDTLILGCTHYPLVAQQIKDFAGRKINVFAQGDIVGNKLKDYLHRHPEMDEKCTKSGTCNYFTTEAAAKFNQSASIFLKENIEAQHLDLQ